MDAVDGPDAPPGVPTGTVTFLLTDVEGSSSRWDADAETMAPAIARHYEILDEAVRRRSGVRPVEQGEGDSIVAVFARASDAVAAALAAQQELTAALGDRFAVRMALHTGEALLRDEWNYFGEAVIRCARLRACAHGGQILVSQSTADLVGDRLPPGAALRDLGEHRLKDLRRPERVFELCHPDLPRAGRFPALRTVDAPHHNLPVQITPLVGRDREVRDAAAMVARERLVTLTGTGGCGKSRLAIEAAGRLLERFPGGVWWCELAPRRESDAVAAALAAALGVVESADVPLAVHVAARLRADGPALVVLDNAEHLLDDVARSTAGLIAEVPDVHVIVTSREPLSVPGEVAWRVPSLPVPPPDAPAAPAALLDFAAVALFVERAARSRPGFGLTAENAAAVAAICRRLDGIPLALELAAARVRTLPPERIAAQLDDRFRLLTGGARTSLPRQQTLLASVAWSEALLDAAERAAWRRLGVFVGGFTLDAAEAVLGSFADTDPYAVLDLVGRLVDKSLVVLDEVTGRYGMLETIRSFALDRLLESGEADTARDAHLAWALEFTTARDAAFERTGEWFDSIDGEWTNLAAALDWAQARPDDALALIAALGMFWLHGQRIADAIAYGFRNIERFAPEPTPMWVRALATTGPILTNAGVDDDLFALMPAAERMAAEHGDDLSALRIQCHVTIRELSTHGPVVALLTRAAALRDRARELGDDLTAFGAAFIPFQELVHVGRLDEADAIPRANLPRHARIIATEASMAMERGQLPLARSLLAEAAALVERHYSAPERFIVARYGQTLRTYSAGEITAPGDRVDLATLGSFTGWWTILRDGVRLRRVIRRQAWDELDDYLEKRPALFLSRVRWDTELSEALVTAGRHDDARSRATGVVAESARVGAPIPEIRARLVLADVDDATSHAREALAVAARHGLVLAQIDALEMLAILAHRAGDATRAAVLKAATTAARDRIGYRFRLTTRDPQYQTIAVPDGTAADSLVDATTFALRMHGARRRPATGWDAVTPTELDVVAHVATGLTNHQIGERLHISASTVKTHLDHIYAKLGINNRAELATGFARREGPDGPART
jgi:predicted ATPase/class 3 adenylate cyclase/DNA-binding CsgD family transcriptional regulator